MADQTIQPNQHANQQMTYDDEIDLLELWDILVEKWQWIAGVTGLSAVIAIVVSLMMTPIYRAEVIVVPADDSGGKGGMAALASQFGGLADLAGVNLGGGGGKGEAIALLKSRALIESFVKENDLLPVLFEDDWDASASKWKSNNPKKVPTMNKAYDLIKKSILTVSEDKKSGVITVAVEWKDRIKAAEWANDIVRRANRAMRERAINEAQASIDYLRQELTKTSVVEIQQAIYRLLEANYKTTSIANAREQYAFKVIDPAVAADEGRKVKPKRSLIVILATLAGGFVAVLGVFLHRGLQTMRQRRAERAI